MIDGFYRAFEERYYAPREVIKALRRQYLPFVQPLAELYAGAATYDAGCGRGEWLELMRELKLSPFGVDLDEGMLAACVELALPAQQGDAISYISSLPSDSQVIVSAFHVLEHITFDQLRTLVAEALRVLKPGGLLIMETPNPENIVVATRNFYLDPTHQRPIPSMLLAFVAEYAGFARVKTLRLQESKELLNKGELSLQDVFSGASPDYAVVAQKFGPDDVLALTSHPFSLDYGLSLENLLSRWDSRFDRLETKAQQAETKAQQAETKAQQAERLVQAVLSSTSWRVTKPLRWMFGGWKQHLKRGLRWAYQKLGRFPWLLALLKRYLTHFPKLEGFALRAISAATVASTNQDEDSLTDRELKALMDLRDAISVSREGLI